MNKRILVAEDDRRLAEILTDALHEAGYQTVTVADGVSALARLQSEPIDLLVLDVNMPGMGGATLVHRLRSDPDLAPAYGEVPVILISGMLDVVTYDLPVQGALTKPFPIAALTAKIRDLIGPA